MSVTLRQPLTLEECQLVREWRNDPAVLPMLRTGYKSEAEQAEFYHTHIAPPIWKWTRWSPVHQYYAIDDFRGRFVGMGGLTHLKRKPGEAEISLILDPAMRGKGLGATAVFTLLAHGLVFLRLRSVIGECYRQGAIQFWAKLVVASPFKTDFEYDDAGSLHWRWTL